MMFSKILIANRGEIACRVIKTARRMGIATVAVYSDADKYAQHVALADEAVHIGAAPSRESYLKADTIIAACKQTGAQAVHPGYGFLSENEQFAKNVEEAGIIFIGPKHGAIAAMGDKIASKKLALAAKVNTIPGHNEAIADADAAVKIAQGVGYPVMIKASAGGGGKGLRVAFNDAEAHAGFTSCANEARASFGDDRIFIEKFVEEPRHIEIQVLGDAHGNMVYLHERECSIQRRHQKVIEEAPSPFITEATRQAMGQQAVSLAQAVGYQSAGTVEFVVGRDQSFYFLEMNTRLQVEHPVTECITGLDLVEQMIRVAAGEQLAFKQADIKRDGWAMECRINADDPYRNFLPSTGRLTQFTPPATTMQASDVDSRYGVRVDTGVIEGGEISMFYDSMIAKLIVHGRDRAEAITKMQAALDAFVIRGISSNIPFQSALLSHPDFASGAFNTGFIAQHYPKGFTGAPFTTEIQSSLIAAACIAHRSVRDRSASVSGQLEGHEINLGEAWVATLNGEQVSVNLQKQGAAFLVQIGEQTLHIQSNYKLASPLLQGTLNGKAFSVQLARKGLDYDARMAGCQANIRVQEPHVAKLSKLMPIKVAPDMSRFLRSPMPGLLTDLLVREGQQVQAGEKLAVIEAMKMENSLFAEKDGVVLKVYATKGQNLAVDETILEFAV
jgi:propionyl-CoA carboxylase alpha chain